MIGCLSALCVLGVTVFGLLIMVQGVTVEQLMNGIGKEFLIALGLMIACCLVTTVLAPVAVAILSQLFHWLKSLLQWLSILAGAVFALWAVTGFVAARVMKRAGKNADSEGGNYHD